MEPESTLLPEQEDCVMLDWLINWLSGFLSNSSVTSPENDFGGMADPGG